MLIRLTQMRVVMSKMAGHPPFVETLNMESFLSSRDGFNKFSSAARCVPCLDSRRKFISVRLLHDHERSGIEQRNLQLVGVCVVFGSEHIGSEKQ